jgi:hypothetical protein
MKIIYNSILPIKGYTAINLFSLVFVRKEYNPISNRIKNHEAIHTAQGKELLWIFFYLLYVTEWLIRLIQYRDRKLAYRNISFEREAYANDRNFDYLKNRKCYSSFKKYIFLK